jgi:hypothetical protein
MDHSDDLAWYLIDGLPASEREDSIRAVGEGRGYPLVVNEARRNEVDLLRAAGSQPVTEEMVLARAAESDAPDALSQAL